MNKYKGRNIIAVVSCAIFGILGILIFILSKGTITNIIAIALFILAIVEFANYYKYWLVVDSNELRITGAFKKRRVEYKNILKILTVREGKTSITYIVDKYMESGKWYIRGTYPHISIEKLKDVQLNDKSELININSYVFQNYEEIVGQLVRKVRNSADIDSETWQVVNTK